MWCFHKLYFSLITVLEMGHRYSRPLDSQQIPSAGICWQSKMALSTGKKVGNSITKSRFWTFLTVLTAENTV